MNLVLIYILLSVVAVSLISLVGLFFLSSRIKGSNFLIFLVSFSAGALLGDVFIHLIPEIDSSIGFGLKSSLYTFLGLGIFFVLEKFIHWRHCHMQFNDKKHIHSFAYMNLVGDGLHNFIDGIIIAAGYLASIPVGFATTIAVVLHEIPQEIGDFGILVQGGFSKRKAVFLNFIIALTAVIGSIVTFLASKFVGNLESFLLPIAAGGFIYIAGSDLIPEMHKETRIVRSLLQLLAFVLGFGVMFALLLLE